MNTEECIYDPSRIPTQGETKSGWFVGEEVIGPSTYILTDYCICALTPDAFPVILDDNIQLFFSELDFEFPRVFSLALLRYNLPRLRMFFDRKNGEELFPAISTVTQLIAKNGGVDPYHVIHVDDVLQEERIRHVLMRLGTGTYGPLDGYTYEIKWKNNQFSKVIRRSPSGEITTSENLMFMPIPQSRTTSVFRVDVQSDGLVAGLFKHRTGMSFEIGGELERYYWEKCIK